MPTFTPLILGSGAAGQAIAKSLAVLNVLEPEWTIAEPIWLKRDQSIADAAKNRENPILVIANPHALHAPSLQKGETAGVKAMICEKPCAVSVDQCESLKSIRTPTAILHVYRQMWGPLTLKKMIRAGDLGDLISIEGRYWQSSVAETALRGSKKDPAKNWKSRPELSGPYDTCVDLGTHWLDMANTFAGAMPVSISGWRTNRNAEAPHRDTHVQFVIEYPGVRGLASISKIAHGATNQFEIQVIGTKKSAAWSFLNPDEVLIGDGRERSVLSRSDTELGSRQWPYHGMGWVEGYIEIIRQLLLEVSGKASTIGYPTLQENVRLMESLLSCQWKD